MTEEANAGQDWWQKIKSIKLTPWRVLGLFCLAFFLIEALSLLWIWPDWDALRKGIVPESALIRDYQAKREDDPKLPKLRWMPVQKSFPKSVKQVFVFAEDSRFYVHGGIDTEAILDAMEYNYRHGKLLVGASTISQQTAKNMFLSLSRSPLRKWHELCLTYLLESFLSKAEIIHIYLNIAEFGKGIYGLEAASRLYYGRSASQLTQSQAIELAASLPSPKKNNPKLRTRSFERRVSRISRALHAVDEYYAAHPKGKAPDSAAAAKIIAEKLEELRRDRDAEAAPDVESDLDEPSAADGSKTDLKNSSEMGTGSGGETNLPAEPAAEAPPNIEAPATAPVEIPVPTEAQHDGDAAP